MLQCSHLERRAGVLDQGLEVRLEPGTSLRGISGGITGINIHEFVCTFKKKIGVTYESPQWAS